MCLNLANCRNARTNYHPTSQQSVPFLVPALSRLRPPPSKVGPAHLIYCNLDARCLRGNPCTGAPTPRFSPLALCSTPLSLSFFLRFDPEIPRWSTVQNGSFDVDYPEIQESGSYDRTGRVVWWNRSRIYEDARDGLQRGRPSHASSRVLRAPAIKLVI